MSWTTEDLVDQLKKLEADNKIYQWSIEIKNESKKEYYYIQSDHGAELDQSRSVDQSNLYLGLYAKKENNKMGRHRQEFFKSLNLENQLSGALDKCEISEEEYWVFNPEVGEAKEVLACYQPILQDIDNAAESLNENLQKSIEAQNKGVFNSAELFVKKENHQTLLSTGLEYNLERSKIYQEVCFSFEESGRSEEFLLTEWGCHPEQIDINKMCENSAHFAEMSLKTQKPESGNYNVLIDSEVLLHLVNDIYSQLNAERKYMKMPFLEKGQKFIEGFKGHNFTLWVDPHKDYGFRTQSFNSAGTLQQPLKLIESNIVVNNRVGTKHSQYLGWPETTEVGNVVIEAEGLSKEELIRQNESTLEILQFSGLFTNNNDLTFSSEIRLAKLHKADGSVSYIKGGNLSGNVKENFSEVKWSKEICSKNTLDYMHALSYFGPKYALLKNVSVVS